MSTYKLKICQTHGAFTATVEKYREATDFFIDVVLAEWEYLSKMQSPFDKLRIVELLTHQTASNLNPKYDFDKNFHKFPSYLRRASLQEAIGKVSSYKSNYENWQEHQQGREPGQPKAGKIYPAMYRDGCFVRTGTFTARLKVFINNTWDWQNIELKKTDVDYIQTRCKNRKECVPTLRRRGKNWYLDFAYEEEVKLQEKEISRQIILSLDLGVNNDCVCCVMKSDGTVIARKFLDLSREKDCLTHALNRIKKAQQHGALSTPRLWARAKGINTHIANLTAKFIVDIAMRYNVDVVIFEHLDLQGKKRGSKKQKLHHWKAQAVQAIVAHKMHRLGKRISRICAWGTSKLAYDGSGEVERDKDNYSMCKFSTGKKYHCDLSASYNIGARFFIREILKSLPVTLRLGMEAKVPSCTKRTTCTLSTLISLNAELAA
ncbi:MAG: hypothetical protein IJU15_00640 [Synergistaceae bacterium]|nr:hypothetical protein [Synergistaceae bacterium]